ncbi:hypothetical protein [Bacillus haikouensis]|nr:hypothetical protein [Bacillus haikouensis]
MVYKNRTYCNNADRFQEFTEFITGFSAQSTSFHIDACWHMVEH